MRGQRTKLQHVALVDNAIQKNKVISSIIYGGGLHSQLQILCSLKITVESPHYVVMTTNDDKTDRRKDLS